MKIWIWILLIVLSAGIGIGGGYLIFGNEFTNLSKDEIIDRLMKYDNLNIKAGYQMGAPTKETYMAKSKSELIEILDSKLKTINY